MYAIISAVSWFVRAFLLPNPFMYLFPDSGLAFVVNLVFGGVLIPLSYVVTGTWYYGGEPAEGSFGFLLNYMLLTGWILLITKFITNLYLVGGLFIIGYILLCICESKLIGDRI